MLTINSRTTTSSKNGGLDAYLKRMEAVKNDTKLQVDVGLVNGMASQELIAIGGYNEFGTHSIPARPFMRKAITGSKPQIKSIMRVQAQYILFGKTNTRNALTVVGEKMKVFIQLSIGSNIAPVNKPATIKAKGHSKTLIDTGAMQKAIKYKVW
jgi:hypothetical protein